MSERDENGMLDFEVSARCSAMLDYGLKAELLTEARGGAPGEPLRFIRLSRSNAAGSQAVLEVRESALRAFLAAIDAERAKGGA